MVPIVRTSSPLAANAVVPRRRAPGRPRTIPMPQLKVRRSSSASSPLASASHRNTGGGVQLAASICITCPSPSTRGGFSTSRRACASALTPRPRSRRGSRPRRSASAPTARRRAGWDRTGKGPQDPGRARVQREADQERSRWRDARGGQAQHDVAVGDEVRSRQDGRARPRRREARRSNSPRPYRPGISAVSPPISAHRRAGSLADPATTSAAEAGASRGGNRGRTAAARPGRRGR